MRTTPISTSRTTILNIRSAAAKISKATQEVSSGLRVTKPSDDPSDAAGIVRTRAELAAIARFRENLESVGRVQWAVDHVSQSQSFYGATLRQAEVTIDNLIQLDTVNTTRLSLHQDADVLKSIGDLQSATAAEQFALQVAARQRPKLLDLLG
jgi:flagellin-like hook-associated protein FlgL